MKSVNSPHNVLNPRDSCPRRAFTNKRQSTSNSVKFNTKAANQFLNSNNYTANNKSYSKMDTSKMSINSDSTMLKTGIGNILGLMDNGIIIFDLNLDGIYNNINIVINKDILSTSNLEELLNFEILTSNCMYTLNRVFRRDIVREFIADFQSF